MVNPILDWAVVVLPTLLSIVGVLVTLEPWDNRHRYQWRGGLILFGVVVSSLTYWQQAKQRVFADANAREFQERLVQEERNSSDKLDVMTERLKSLDAQIRQPNPATGSMRQPPTAEEIAAALSDKLKGLQPVPTTGPAKTAQENFAVPVVPPPVMPSVTEHTRSDPFRAFNH